MDARSGWHALVEWFPTQPAAELGLARPPLPRNKTLTFTRKPRSPGPKSGRTPSCWNLLRNDGYQIR